MIESDDVLILQACTSSWDTTMAAETARYRRDVQRIRIGVVVARDLLGQQVDHRRPELERIRIKLNSRSADCQAGEIGRRQVLVELWMT